LAVLPHLSTCVCGTARGWESCPVERKRDLGEEKAVAQSSPGSQDGERPALRLRSFPVCTGLRAFFLLGFLSPTSVALLVTSLTQD